MDQTKQELQAFKSHLEDTVTQLLDDLDVGKDLEKYDLTITVNGKSITLPMHADLYSKLEQMIREELEEL